ncbi:unnamed protein product [Orchesella dallaii]|uniref:Gustatory receptor n=1 Tax=Orchesella dallaii TaxID=48710 RepID=A0ABP1RHU3_9HEXA
MYGNDQTKRIFVTPQCSKPIQKETKLRGLNRKDYNHVVPRKRVLLHWYFLAGYYTLCIPYKLRKRESDQAWKLESWWFQKLLCLFISWPLTWAWLITGMAQQLPGFYVIKDYHAKHYLNLVNVLLSSTFYFKFQWILVSKREKLEKLLNDVSTFSLFQLKKLSTPQKSRVCEGKMSMLTAYFIFMYVSCIGWICKAFFDKPISEIITSGRRRFFLENLKSNFTQLHVNGTLVADELYSNANILVGCADLALSFKQRVDYTFVTMFFCHVLSTTFLSASKLFKRFLAGIDCICVESSSTHTGSSHSIVTAKIMEKYKELRNLVASINAVWSTMILFYIIGRTVDLINNFNQSIEKKEIATIFATVTLRLLLVIMLVMLADGYRINTSIKLWLCKRGYIREEISSHGGNELECLERCVEHEPVGIGEVGVFEINYEFLAQLLIFSVTAFLITF